MANEQSVWQFVWQFHLFFNKITCSHHHYKSGHVSIWVWLTENVGQANA